MFHNINRSASYFFRAAGIRVGSKEHKELTATIRALYRQYLHPFKYLEEQAPERVDQLIAKARIRHPWLTKYENDWPARIYLKRYVDGRRPHLLGTGYDHSKQIGAPKSRASSTGPMGNLEDPNDVSGNRDFIIRDFLASLTPNLEHRLDAFVQLGIKDQETLHAFLSWPQYIQAQFLDEGHATLQLTSLETKGLLTGCSLLAQKVLQQSLVNVVKPGNF